MECAVSVFRSARVLTCTSGPPAVFSPWNRPRPLWANRALTVMGDGANGAASNGGEHNSFSPVKLPPSSNGPRPHRCEICQRSFRELATLRKHEQLHRADRPYVCQTCGKSFLWSSNLKVHERVHTGERPYKCKICHRCFTQSNDLRRHERNVHMRGKLYGYKHGPIGMGRGVPPPGAGSHVNLAAYQAFAMQQRALLQQALTYESYLHTAAVTQGQMFPQPPPAPLMHARTEGIRMPGASRPGMIGPGGMEEREGGEGQNQRSPIKLEQVSPPGTPGEAESGGMGEKRIVPAGPPPPPHPPPHHPDSLQHSPVTSRFVTTSSGPGPIMHVASPLRSPPMLLPVGPGPFPMKDGPSPLHHSPHQLSPPGGPRGPLPSFSSFRSGQRDGNEYEQENRMHTPTSMSMLLREAQQQAHGRRSVDSRGEHDQDSEGRDKYPCDSVMDLSVNKSDAGSEKADTERDDQSMPPPKTPSSESECEGKRDVTTTSATPVADSGIHHCQHCNIFFYDYTMYHLHESLHLPYEDYPFRCPSCGKDCQDRIEFMFHTVWHVKYPHTIPNYQPFKENFIS